MVDCSMVGLVFNGLSHLNNCNNRLSFIAGLIKGEETQLDVDTIRQ